MFATMNRTAAYTHPPRSIVAISSVAATPISMKTESIRFLSARWSAMAPRIGLSTATIEIAIVVAHANRAVASAGASPAAA